MNPELTEQLICPRCGPRFGLILRADEVRDGAVVHGFLGCSNCRNLYPVEKGVADLRAQPRSRSRIRRPPGPERPPQLGAPEIAALVGGIPGAPGLVVLGGSLTGQAAALERLLHSVRVVALAARGFPPGSGTGRLLVSERIPLRSGSSAGIALAGLWAEQLLDEAVRCLRPRGRVVLGDASSEGEQAFSRQGLTVLAAERRILVGRLG